MNTVSLAATQTSVNWQTPAYINAAIDAGLSPRMVGALDAERGDEACPEMYFLSRGQQCEYCEGYEEVAGPTLTTGQFLGVPEPAIEDDYDWIRFGC